MNRTSLFLATALALAAGPVLAQNSSSSTTHPTTTTNTTAATNSGQFLASETGNEWRASKLKGLNVYNNSNEKLGSIDDVLIDKSGQVKAVVIGVGGFLGIGDHQVGVPFSQLQFSNEAPRNTAAVNNAHPANPAGTTTGTVTGLGSPGTTPANTVTATPTGPTNTAARRMEDTPDHAVLNATRDQLKAAPAFQWNKS